MTAVNRSPNAPLMVTPPVRPLSSARGSRRFLFPPAVQALPAQPIVQHGILWNMAARIGIIALAILRPIASMAACWVVELFICPSDLSYQAGIKCEKIKQIIPNCPAIQETAHGIAKSLVTYFKKLMNETPRVEEPLRSPIVKNFFYSGGSLTFSGGIVKRFLSKEENCQFITKLVELNVLNAIHHVLGLVKDLDTQDGYFLKNLALRICLAVTGRLTAAKQKNELPTFPAAHTTEQILDCIKKIAFPNAKDEIDISSLGALASFFNVQEKMWDKVVKSFTSQGTKVINLLGDDATRTKLIYMLISYLHTLLGGRQPVRQASVTVRRPSNLLLNSGQRTVPNTHYDHEDALQKALVDCIDHLGATLSSTNYVACRASFLTDKKLVKWAQKISEKLAKYNLTSLVTFGFQYLTQKVQKPNDATVYLRIEYLLDKTIIHSRTEEEAARAEKERIKKTVENNLQVKLTDLDNQWVNIKNLLVQDREDANVLTRGFNFVQRQVTGSVVTNPIRATFDETYRMLHADNFKPLLVFLICEALQVIAQEDEA